MKAGILPQAYVLQLLDGSFSAVSLSARSGQSYAHTSRYLNTMHAKGLVKRASGTRIIGSGGRSRLRGLAPSTYRLTRKGRSLFRVVLTGGVFDVIHPGHIHVLKEASGHGDILVVVLARDSTVRKRKQRPPVNPEQDRLEVVSSIMLVDAAIPGSTGSFLETLKKVGPDTIFLGHDQEADLQRFRRLSRRLSRRPGIILSSSPLRDYSTTRIVGSIKGQ